MRDHLVPGTVEKILLEIEEFKDAETKFSNKFLEGYALNIISRMK
jgi:hypothetical protein